MEVYRAQLAPSSPSILYLLGIGSEKRITRMECKLQLLLWQEHLQWHCCSSSSRVIPSSYQCNKSEPSCFKLKQKKYLSFSNSTKSLRLRPLGALPENERNRKEQPMIIGIDGHEVGNSGVIISSCLVGVLTGIGVVLFNKGVHEIRDFFWDGIPYGGASWLREKPIPAIWIRVVLVPACGGFIVSILNQLRYALSLDDDDDDDVQQVQDKSYPPPHPQAQAKDDISVITVSSTTSLPTIYYDYLKIAFQPLLKAVAACITLGTGNSLGPEGPSVEIGKSIAKGVGNLFDRRPRRKVSLVAAGSAAGISSGFNAAVAGCFFAVESVIWPSPAADSSASLAYTTSMVILSAVIASVVSEVGLGSEPAFKVPEYDFRSPGELPLYLLLGVLCGLISLTLSRCTTYMLAIVDNLQKDNGIPKAVFPVMGGLAVGLIALMFPEILYWGFENVDILLESRPFVKGLTADMLLQLVAAKIVATSLCRASGLVGGYYAPSLFIGAATGMAYGKFINFAIAQSNPTIHFSILEVASPQAYGLVGMAATLAGVCQVPLTSVLLLFELTQDYRIVLPLLGAVGLSSWFTSGQMRRRDVKETKVAVHANTNRKRQFEIYTSRTRGLSSSDLLAEEEPYAINLCEVESSLCIDDWNLEVEELKRRVFVSEVMRTRYVTVLMTTLLIEAVTLMLAEKQSCAMIVDDDNILIGILTLGDIEEFSKNAQAKTSRSKKLLVSEMCSADGETCCVPCTATPNMNLLSALILMDRYGVNQVPVVMEHIPGQRGQLVGLLDRESIILTCRALATRKSLS